MSRSTSRAAPSAARLSGAVLATGICLCACSAPTSTPQKSDAGTTPAFVGSGLGPDEIPLRVDHVCPGDPACADQGDGLLYVGAAKRDITPVIEPFEDLNGNDKPDADEPYTDLNGNGKFDGVWLAGRDSGTYAFAVHDPAWVRCYVVRYNQTTVAHCVVDSLGVFLDEDDQIRADLDPALGIDLFMLGATHDHQMQDMMGIWGPDDTTTGYRPDYMKHFRELTIEAVTEAVQGMKPAKMSIASIKTQDPPDAADGTGNMRPYISDTRDPVVIDPTMHIMQFDGASDGKPIVTVVNWGAHPDSLGSDRHYISSDWVNYFRADLEAGTGCDVIYVQGQCGGQIGPGEVQPVAEDGTVLTSGDGNYRFVEAWGRSMARVALGAFGNRTDVTAPALTFRHTRYGIHLDNVFYVALINLGLTTRHGYGYDPKKPLIRDENGDNAPMFETEIAYLTLGPATIITAPGELLPENFVGGYDASYSGGYVPFINTMEPNAPNPALAPKPPYLRDMMIEGPLEHRMVYGLTLDMTGYIVPRYDFVLSTIAPYVARADGDHYEETASAGIRAEPEIVGTMRQLVMSAHPGK